MEDELTDYLAALGHDDSWRVDAVLKQGGLETTERVYFVGRGGAELGPFVRKRLAPGLGGAYERLLEAQRAGRRLPHLPRIVECGRQDGQLVVVMELVAGQTLAEAVTGSRNRPALVRRVFPDLCEAVAELHESFSPPIIHRDLKPGNVMVSESGVTLIDLGIARTWRPGGEKDTTHFGTRAYAPPEQFGFGQTGVASDVYALGMLLFFCLAGRDPAAPDRERGFADEGVPEALRAVIARAADLDPAKRYASARELKDALLGALPAAPAEKDALAPALPASQLETPTFESPTLGARLGALLDRVPLAAGVVWDVCCLLTLLVFLAGCVIAIVEPTGQNASWPTWYLVYSYAGMMMPLCAISCLMIMDRRPLRRLFPQLRRYTLRQELRAEIIFAFAVAGLWMVVTMVVRP